MMSIDPLLLLLKQTKAYVIILVCLVISISNGFNKNHVHHRYAATTISSSSLSMTSTITNGVIIGAGRIGSFLYDANDKKDIFLSSRNTLLTSQADNNGPIYICTRNNDLDGIINSIPSNRHDDLVFLQNGILTDYLQSKKLAHVTQGLIYFAISKKGEKPIDGITDINPNGLTAITGKWADDFAARLHSQGLTCHVLDYNQWEIAMIEKHIWICAFMAIGARYGGITVGDVEKNKNEEVVQLINQLAYAATMVTKVKFPAGLSDRLCAYARSVAHFPTALKEFEWRNGWFADITLHFIHTLRDDPCPLHTDILIEKNMLRQARQAYSTKLRNKALVSAANMERYKNGMSSNDRVARAPVNITGNYTGVTISMNKYNV